ncbi:MAG: hypothetical protein CL920_27510 [Deltaproteobacteria bacterium]|nr:hypothetical protein [Deltaproteobacteria bacterium]MBU52459.1 hypothetical protein [Deltaproteobacteria bacterium]
MKGHSFFAWLWSAMVACLVGGVCYLPACTSPDNRPDGGNIVTPPPIETITEVEYDNKGFQIKWSQTSQKWELYLGTKLLSALPVSGLELGLVDAIDEKFNYDPFWLDNDTGKTYPPDSLEWVAPSSIKVASRSPVRTFFTLTYPKGATATLSLEIARDGAFLFTLTPDQLKARVAYIRLKWAVTKEENFYGLGEYFDQVAHRGKLRAMQIELDAKIESGYNEAHVPVSFFTSTLGWGLFVDTYKPGVFDMARKDPQTVQVTYGTNELKFYALAANHPLDVPGIYTRLTGTPAVPATWAFGTLLWRDENKDQAEVLDDAAQIRKHDLAISAMWIDRPYDVGVNNFGFDSKRYPDPAAMIGTLQKTGFRLGLWSTPYLEPDKTDHYKVFKENGWFVKMGITKLNKWSDPVDLTNPDAANAFKKLIRRYVDMGIEGFKLDYGEDIQVGVTKNRFSYGFYNGENSDTMHHKYMLYYHKTYYDTLNEGGHFLICRAGTNGGQKYASIIWPGDLNTGFQKHYECPSNGDKCYVGGLIASIIGGLSLSQSGYHFYGSDTGGYRAPRPTKQAFIRWGQQTALSTIMQIGGADPNVNPWDFTKYGDSQFDQEVLDTFRKYIRLHTRLFPYNYTYAMQAQVHGRGATRPYGMAFPEENYHPNDQYMFGEFLMVAPVVDDKLTRKVHFPKAHKWITWEGDQVFEGGKVVDFNAPLTRLPLFMKYGSIVPLLRPDVDTLSPVFEQKDIVSTYAEAGPLHLRVAPGEDATFKLYDGTSVTFKQAETMKITLLQGTAFTDSTEIVLLNVKKPSKVLDNTLESKEETDDTKFKVCVSCWKYDAQNAILTLRTTSETVLDITTTLNK